MRKMDSLKKYVPFIDYVLNIDRKKYIKFINIRKWIIQKKNFPLSDLNKIEQSIITQYKNLLLENNVQTPQNIATIFAPMKLKSFVNLCSDDEEDEVTNKKENNNLNNKNATKTLGKKGRYSNTKKVYTNNKIVDESDDDLEFISVDYVAKAQKKTGEESTNKINLCDDEIKEEISMDQASIDILSRIDQIAEDDKKMINLVHEPVNYTYTENNHMDLTLHEEAAIYERRTTNPADELFKRRADFSSDEVEVQNLDNQNSESLYTKPSIDVISLDSDSDNEDKDGPSNSNVAELNTTTDNAAEKTNEVLLNTSDNGNKAENVEFLCNTIDDVSLDINEVFNEIANINDSTSNSSDRQLQNETNDTNENIVQPISDNSTNDTITCDINPSLNPQQISKILEDISSKKDFQLETLYEALAFIIQKTNVPQNDSNLETVRGATPPPAPPPINNNMPTTSVQLQPTPCYPTAQQQTSMMPRYHINSNFNPMTSTAPPRPKININDPRIRKEIQAIQNSPLLTYNILNTQLEESIYKLCQAQQLQLQPTKPQTASTYTNKNNTPCSKTSNNGNKSSITYGEYKRRQLEKKLETERQKEEERMAREKTQREAEQLKLNKNTDENIRSKLLSTLNPCKEQLTTLWSQQKQTEETNITKEKKQNVISPSKDPKQSKKKKEGPSAQTNSKHTHQKLNRIYNELQCTVKGFDHILDYIPNTTETSNESSNCVQSDEDSQSAEITTRNIGLRRRSSLYALSAISEQLGQHSSDCSDVELSRKSNSKRLLSESRESPLSDNLEFISKRRKTTEDVIQPTKRAKKLRITDDTSSESEISDVQEINKITKEPVIRLHRLTEDFIRQHTRRSIETNEIQNPPEGELSSKLKKTCEKVQKPKETSQRIPKLRKYNNDCQMTERNTSFCVLCRSKPSDLANHYIGRHKTESYVSRLDWSELEDLTINTPFAKLQSKTKAIRFDRYQVKCPFCNEMLLDRFINFYNHYSAHTGEYAFQCSCCHHAKPYRPDIQSHILHSKPCRNATIQIMYRYPPNAQCIFLHYCTICNFVQLNEANVLKHLREHHAPAKAIPRNVHKCVLAAMSDGPDTSEVNKSPSPTPAPAPAPAPSTSSVQQALSLSPSPPPISARSSVKQQKEKMFAISYNVISDEATLSALRCNAISDEVHVPLPTVFKFKVDDDDVPVGNEPCLEEEFLEADKHTLEQQLKHLHEGSATTTNLARPMTIIHSMESNINNSSATQPAVTSLNSTEERRHVPIIIKKETMEAYDKLRATPRPSNYRSKQKNQINLSSVLRNYAVYEKYRSYPQNVNYLGLYKCMIDDCYYSTDCSNELCKHLTEHYAAELKPNEYLQCSYCDITTMDNPMTPAQLVEHVRSQHGHLNYQCSMCCYRSCDASNVHIHQQIDHCTDVNICKIYKCSSDDVMVNNKQQNPEIDKQIAMNVFKISCKRFYNTELLINHLEKEHRVSNAYELKIYSCIYCPLTVENKSQIRNHVARKHPKELPLIYDHNKPVNYITKEDIKTNANVVNLSEPVTFIEIQSTVSDITEEKENLSQEVKPDISQLLGMNEEIAKVRLQKLTANTGIPPDSLYHCPEQMCGGFFSIFELWMRHMRVRHHAMECQCPHCKKEMLLEQFAEHFEQHRRHTFICFHCSTTTRTEILARQHFAERHANMSSLRFEKVRCNLSYSYSIIIQSDLFTERKNFIAELLTLLDNRLMELESNENRKLKHQWPVRDNIPWIRESLENLFNRKTVRRCLMKDCNFRAYNDDSLYQHITELHNIADTKFNCSKCDYHIERCNNLDELFNHIKQHNSKCTYICAACSTKTSSRSKMSIHIEEHHSARDVAVVNLFGTTEETYIKVYISFSEHQLTFSTMKNCFCCSEQNMSGDVYTLHLKRYHKLSLNYYCEKCNNFLFNSLNEVKPHFQQVHMSTRCKIRCELAGHNDLNVTSLNEFQVQILQSDFVPQKTLNFLHVKNEPLEASDSDDNVILLEDDDIAIQNSLKNDHLKAAQEIPKLKCASFSRLIEDPAAPVSLPPLQSFSQHSTILQSYLGSNNPNFHQAPSASSLPAASATAQFIMPQDNYTIGNTLMSATYSPSFTSMTTPVQTDSRNLFYNNVDSSFNQPTNVHFSSYLQNSTVVPVPNTNNRRTPIYNSESISTNRSFVITQTYDAIPRLNVQKSNGQTGMIFYNRPK